MGSKSKTKQNIFRSRSHSTAGFTLVELMIAMGIAGLVSLIVAVIFTQSKRTIADLTTIAQMKTVAATLQSALENHEVVLFNGSLGRTNYDGISELINCLWDPAVKNAINPSSAGECITTDPEQQSDIELFQPSQNPKTFNRERQRIGGSKQHPAWYDRNGLRNCNPDDPKTGHTCVFKVTTYFWANCPEDAVGYRQNLPGSAASAVRTPSSCNRADTINFRFQVTYVPSQKKQFANQKIKSLPPIPDLDEKNPTGLAVAVSTSKFAHPWEIISNCPPNFTLTDIVDGETNCQCLLPFQKIDAKTCRLPKNVCPPNSRYKGTTLSGQRDCRPLQCDPPREQKISIQENTPFDSLNFVCARPKWISKIEAASPTANCTCTQKYAYADREAQTWQYGCSFACSFNVTCCWEL